MSKRSCQPVSTTTPDAQGAQRADEIESAELHASEVEVEKDDLRAQPGGRFEDRLGRGRVDRIGFEALDAKWPA